LSRREEIQARSLLSSRLLFLIKDLHTIRSLMSSSSQMLSPRSLIEFLLPLRDMKTTRIFLLKLQLQTCSHKIIVVESRENSWMRNHLMLISHHREAKRVICVLSLTLMNKEWWSRHLASLDLTTFNLAQVQVHLHNLISITSIPLVSQYLKTFKLKRKGLIFNRDRLQAAISKGSITYLLILEMKRIARRSSQQEDSTIQRPILSPTTEIILSTQSLRLLMVTRRTQPKLIKR